MNLVGMDIIPEADGNTEEKWRELFGRQEGTSKEFQENDGHRSMPTMHHARLSRQVRGAPSSKAQESRLNPLVWTRQALPFVFDARPEPVIETEAIEATVTTVAFDRSIPGRSTSGGYFVRQENPQTPDNRFWARLSGSNGDDTNEGGDRKFWANVDLQKTRTDIMTSVAKDRWSDRDIDDIQEEGGGSQSNQPDKPESPPSVDNKDPNEGILRSIPKTHWSNRKKGDIPEAFLEHENTHTSFQKDPLDAIERGDHPTTNQSSNFTTISPNELSLVSHDSTMTTIRRSNRQGERSETFSSGDFLFGFNEMDYVITDDISSDDAPRNLIPMMATTMMKRRTTMITATRMTTMLMAAAIQASLRTKPLKRP
jgi:hypothetical protein